MPWPTNEGNKINLHLKWLSKLYNNLGVRSHPGVILGPFGSFVLNILVLWSRLAQLLDAVLRHITLCHGLTMSRDVKRSCHSCHSMAPLPMAPSQEGTSALRSSDSDAGDQADLYKRCLHAWCMPGACLLHAWCQAAGYCDRFHPGCFRQRAICQQPSRTSSPAKPRSRMESHQDYLQWEHLCSKW